MLVRKELRCMYMYMPACVCMYWFVWLPKSMLNTISEVGCYYRQTMTSSA